jgi:hypothetical protein
VRLAQLRGSHRRAPNATVVYVNYTSVLPDTGYCPDKLPITNAQFDRARPAGENTDRQDGGSRTRDRIAAGFRCRPDSRSRYLLSRSVGLRVHVLREPAQLRADGLPPDRASDGHDRRPDQQGPRFEVTPFQRRSGRVTALGLAVSRLRPSMQTLGLSDI